MIAGVVMWKTRSVNTYLFYSCTSQNLGRALDIINACPPNNSTSALLMNVHVDLILFAITFRMIGYGCPHLFLWLISARLTVTPSLMLRFRKSPENVGLLVLAQGMPITHISPT